MPHKLCGSVSQAYKVIKYRKGRTAQRNYPIIRANWTPKNDFSWFHIVQNDRFSDFNKWDRLILKCFLHKLELYWEKSSKLWNFYFFCIHVLVQFLQYYSFFLLSSQNFSNFQNFDPTVQFCDIYNTDLIKQWVCSVTFSISHALGLLIIFESNISIEVKQIAMNTPTKSHLMSIDIWTFIKLLSSLEWFQF